MLKVKQWSEVRYYVECPYCFFTDEGEESPLDEGSVVICPDCKQQYGIEGARTRGKESY